MPSPNRAAKAAVLLAAASLIAASCASSSTAAPTSTTTPAITVPATSAPTTVAPTTAAPTTTPPTTAVPTTTLVPVDAAEFGPYQVGRATVTLVDSSRDGRTLPVDIWYPVDQGVPAEASIYTFAPGIAYSSDHALADPEISADGPFPLVIYSHGSNSQRYFSAFLTERLASHGFVVVAPDHPGNTLIDAFIGTSDTPETAERERLFDISFVLTSVLTGTGEPMLDAATASIDADNIGIVGHSLGGWTGLQLVAGNSEIESDSRVKAVVGMAAITTFMSDESLQAVDVPTLLIGGTLDETTPIQTNLDRPFDLISGRPLYRVDIDGAGHQSFSDVCYYQQIVPQIPGVPEAVLTAIDSYAVDACTERHLDWVQAQRIIDTYTIGFFIDQLTDRSDGAPIFSAAYADGLTPVEFAGQR